MLYGGWWDDAGHLVWVQSFGGESPGNHSLRTSERYESYARRTPLALARAWFRCFRSFAELGGFVLTDFTIAQFAVRGDDDSEPKVALVDGPYANAGPPADAVERTFRRWNAKFNRTAEPVNGKAARADDVFFEAFPNVFRPPRPPRRRAGGAKEDKVSFKPGRSTACRAATTTAGGVLPPGASEDRRPYRLESRGRGRVSFDGFAVARQQPRSVDPLLSSAFVYPLGPSARHPRRRRDDASPWNSQEAAAAIHHRGTSAIDVRTRRRRLRPADVS